MRPGFPELFLVFCVLRHLLVRRSNNFGKDNAAA